MAHSVPRQEEPLFPVAETFVSINGEGLHAGQFCAFIRFAGCNLSCSYCDTRWACDGACQPTPMSAGNLVRFVIESHAPCVTLTGGEPLLQPSLPKLVEALVRSTSCFVEIETNGSCDLGKIARLRKSLEGEGYRGRIGFTMDWKLPESDMGSHMLEENLALLGKGLKRHSADITTEQGFSNAICCQDCVKFVAGSALDLLEAKRVILENDLLDACPILFSPVFGKIEPAEIVSFLNGNDLQRARIQLQMHKIIWPNVERGV